MPVRAKVLVNCCIDFRFVDPLIDWLRALGLRGQYDLRTHEGCALTVDQWLQSDAAIDRHSHALPLTARFERDQREVILGTGGALELTVEDDGKRPWRQYGGVFPPKRTAHRDDGLSRPLSLILYRSAL